MSRPSPASVLASSFFILDASGYDESGGNVLQKLCGLVWLEPISSILIDQLLQRLHVSERDDCGCTSRHYLVINFDQADAIRYILSQGADVNAVDQEGNAPIHEVIEVNMVWNV